MKPDPADRRVLLLEIGNTSVRAALPSATGGVRLVRRLATRELTAEALQSLARRHGAEAVALCSVVPRATALVRAALAQPLLVASAAGPLPFALADDLPQPGRIGPDRLLGVAGALALGARGPLVVIDAGTACTFNVLDARGVFRGGAIAPGLAAFVDYLAERTARLPRVTLGEIARAGAIGRETRAAIAAACRHGFVGQARGLVQAIAAELGLPPRRLRVLVTGGAAPLLADGLGWTAEPSLVLRGLAQCALRWRADAHAGCAKSPPPSAGGRSGRAGRAR